VAFDVIVPAVALKVAVVAPAATAALAGAVKRALLLEMVTDTPPDGAAPDNVSVHVELPPVPTLDGAQLIELRTTETESDRLAVLLLPL
jgi:hypothetical protein